MKRSHHHTLDDVMYDGWKREIDNRVHRCDGLMTEEITIVRDTQRALRTRAPPNATRSSMFSSIKSVFICRLVVCDAERGQVPDVQRQGSDEARPNEQGLVEGTGVEPATPTLRT